MWFGFVFFLDFFNFKGKVWWIEEIVEFYKKVFFDGFWIDMNEVFNFCNGNCCKFSGVVYFNKNECYLVCKKLVL